MMSDLYLWHSGPFDVPQILLVCFLVGFSSCVLFYSLAF